MISKQGARIIALDIANSLINAQAELPTDMTCQQLDDDYGYAFSSDDQEKIWTALGVIAAQIASKHTRALNSLPAYTGQRVYLGEPIATK